MQRLPLRSITMKCRLIKNLYQMFLTSVAVVVAAVPEGLLPAMVIILAVGMQKILKKKAYLP